MQNDNIYMRLATAEAAAKEQQAEQLDTLQRAYKCACNAGNAEDAAKLGRAIRNKLLDNSDKEMSLDRLGLDTSTATKFVTSLVKVFKGAWAEYRQQLRDIPEQADFPFNITFPTPPDSTEEE